MYATFIGCVLLSAKVNAATLTSVTSGNWNSASTWSPALVPVAGDIINIVSNHQITVNTTTANCATLNIGPSTGNNTSVLTFASTGSPSLTVTGTITIGGNNVNRSGAINFTAGSTLIANNIQLGSAAGGPGTINMTNGGTLRVTGAITNPSGTPTFTPGTGTVEFTANNTLPTGITSFNNLTISSGTTTLSTNINSTTTGSLTIRAGATLALSTFSYGAVTAIPTVNMECGAATGALISGSGTLRIGPTLNINDAVAAGTSAASIAVPITFTAATAFNVANDGSAAADLTINGTINANSFRLTKSGAGTFQRNGFALNLSGPFDVVAGTYNANGQATTVTGLTTVSGTGSYLAGSGIQTFNGGLTVSSSFTGNTANISTTALTISSGTFNATTSEITITDNFSNSGTFNSNSGTVTFANASANQSITGNTSFHNLTISKTTGGTVTLNSNITVAGTLTFASGNNGTITTGTNQVNVSNNAGGAVVRSGNGYVLGNLQRAIATGANSYLFPIGRTNYNPATINFTSNTSAGTILASANDGISANYPASFNQVRFLNEHWLINPTGLTTFAASATFSFNAGDLAGGATAANLRGYQRQSSSTTFPSTTTTASTFTVSGLSALGEFGAGECGSFSVNSSSITGAQCNGSTNGSIQTSVTGGSGTVTYNWSGPNSFNNSSANPTGLAAGTYNVTVTDAAGCTATNSFTVTQPSVISISTSSNPVSCFNGNNGSAQASASGGTPGYTYNWSTGGSGTNISALTAGTYTVTVTDSRSCTSSTTVSVSQPTLLTATVSADVSEICINDTVDVTVSASGGTTPYTGTGSFIAVQGTNSYTVTDGNGCTATTSIVITVIADTIDPVIQNCPANIVTCDPQVSWTVPSVTDNCGATMTGSHTSGSTFPLGVTTVTYTATDGSGNVSTCSFTITVNQASVAPTSITSSAGNAFCFSGNSQTTLKPNGGSLGTNTSWKWYEGNCGGTLIATGDSVQVNPAATTNYFVRAEGDCGLPTCRSITIQIDTILNVASFQVSGPGFGCSGNSGVFRIPPVASAQTYTWSIANATVNGQSVPVTTPDTFTTVTFGSLPTGISFYYVCLTAENSCGSSPQVCSAVRGAISTPGFTVAPTVVCKNSTVSYSVGNVPGAVSYNWTISGTGAVINGSGSTVNITFDSTFTSGQLCATGVSPCGPASGRCINISSTPPLPGGMSGPTRVCNGTTHTFSIAPMNFVAGYAWTLPRGASIVANNGNSVTVAFSSIYGGGTICVRAVSSCGVQGPSRCLTVATDKLPTPGNISGQTNGVCGGTFTYSVAAIAGATSYTWTIPAAATVIGNSTSNSITLQFNSSFTSGNLCVKANNSCGAGYDRCIPLTGNPSTPVQITGTSSVCSGTQYRYSWASVAGATSYLVTAPFGSSIVGGSVTTSNFVDIVVGANSGMVTVRAQNNCGVSGTRTLSLNIACRTIGEENLTDNISAEAYPNPSNGYVNIRIDADRELDYNIVVMDQTGRLLKRDIVRGSVSNLIQQDYSDLNNGIYLLRIEWEGGYTSKSLIIQH